MVRFAAPLAMMSDRLLAEAGSLEAIDVHSCRYVSAPGAWEWLAIAVALVGVPYTIEGPPELIACSCELAAGMARATEGGWRTPWKGSPGKPGRDQSSSGRSSTVR